MAEGILTLNPISPERDPDKLGGPGYIEAPVGVGLALANMFKKRGIGDNNPPSPIEEEKPPKKEPPKDPENLLNLLGGTMVKKLNEMKDKNIELTDEQEAQVDAFDLKKVKSKDFKNWKKIGKSPYYKNPDYPNVFLRREIASGVLRPWTVHVGKGDFVARSQLISSPSSNKQETIFKAQNLQKYLLRKEKAYGGLIDKPLTGNSRYI